MLQMDQVTAIRHAVLGLGKSRRWAARTFKVARGTVDNYVDQTVTPRQRKTAAKEAPKTTAAATKLAALIGDVEVSRKQQLTAQRAWELLKADGVDVSYTIVKELMAARRRAVAEVFVPLTYPPGDLAEVDFFEVDVIVNGEKVVAWLFLMRLMSSSRDFCWLYSQQNQTAFLGIHPVNTVRTRALASGHRLRRGRRSCPSAAEPRGAVWSLVARASFAIDGERAR